MKMIWQKDPTDYKTVLCALLAGAGAGLAVGLLMAPKTGEQMRADIGSAVDDYVESARQKAEDLRASATNLAQRGLREVQKTKDAVAETVADAVAKGEKEAHHAIHETVTAVESGARKGHAAVHEAATAVRAGVRG